jgi:hypothetical protein
VSFPSGSRRPPWLRKGVWRGDDRACYVSVAGLDKPSDNGTFRAYWVGEALPELPELRAVAVAGSLPPSSPPRPMPWASGTDSSMPRSIEPEATRPSGD